MLKNFPLTDESYSLALAHMDSVYGGDVQKVKDVPHAVPTVKT